LGLYFCGILDPAAVQDCTKYPSLITNVMLQLEYITSVMKNVLSNNKRSSKC